MITAIFINIINIFMSITAVLLPSWKLPDYIIDTFNTGFEYLVFFNGYLPIEACFKIFIIILTLEIYLFFARIVFGVISYIRGGGNVEI